MKFLLLLLLLPAQGMATHLDGGWRNDAGAPDRILLTLHEDGRFDLRHEFFIDPEFLAVLDSMAVATGTEPITEVVLVASGQHRTEGDSLVFLDMTDRTVLTNIGPLDEALTALAEALAEEIIREGNIPEEQQEQFRQDFVTAFLGSTPLFDPVDISAVGRYDQDADTLTIEGLVLVRGG